MLNELKVRESESEEFDQEVDTRQKRHYSKWLV